MTAWIENHAANVAGALFAWTGALAFAALVAGLGIWGISSALNEAHLQMERLRKRRADALRSRMEQVERLLK